MAVGPCGRGTLHVGNGAKLVILALDAAAIRPEYNLAGEFSGILRQPVREICSWQSNGNRDPNRDDLW